MGPQINELPSSTFPPFLNGSDKQVVADKILTSFKEIGLNHGQISAQPRCNSKRKARIFALSKEFFAQPMDVKMLAPYPPTTDSRVREASDLTGYSAPGQYKISHHVYDAGAIAQHREQAPDAKESFECGREGDEVMQNIWFPDGILPGFKETCLELFWIHHPSYLSPSLCHAVRLDIMRALAVGFDLPEEYFLKVHTAPDNLLRLLHYPSVPVEALHTDKIARIGEHSDFGSITLLLQDDVGGLEVEDPRSNDTIRSTIHRVRTPPGVVHTAGMTPERYSIPYDFSTVVDCIPGTWDADRPKKYEPISAQEYIMERMAASGDVLNDFDSIVTWSVYNGTPYVWVPPSTFSFFYSRLEGNPLSWGLD
ncbi:Clavaminate synthase-like protein [Mycena vulgaris]|nr:Clavaminate synthase-like protein [Mycena vulgaris]